MNLIEYVESQYTNKEIPNFGPGDTVRAHLRVIEGGKERVQIFEGVCIKRVKKGVQESMTLRKISGGVGVERTIPIQSPKLKEIEVVRRGRVRRARLYYLRNRVGKKARIREKRDN